MILDYNQMSELLSGTHLSGLSESQLEDAIIGEYPIVTHGQRQIDRLWSDISDDDLILNQLEISRHRLTLDSALIKLYKNPEKNKNSIDNLESILGYIEKTQATKIDNLALLTFVKDCQLAMLKSERIIRRQALEIESHKKWNEELSKLS